MTGFPNHRCRSLTGLGIVLMVLMACVTMADVRKVRVLLDLSRRASNNLSVVQSINRESNRSQGETQKQAYVIRRNYGPLTADLLASYHIVFVPGSQGRGVKPPEGGWPASIQKMGFDVRYDSAEIAALEHYIKNRGGRVLLFGSGQSWSRRCRLDAQANGIPVRPITEMPLNQLARPLGIRFLDESVHRNAWRCPGAGNVLNQGRPSFAEVLKSSLAGAIEAPPNPTILAQSRNESIVAAGIQVGRGWVVAISLNSFDRQFFRGNIQLAPGIRALLAWSLSQGAYEPPAADPGDRVHLPAVIRETRFVRIRAIESMRGRALEAFELARHAETFFPKFLGLTQLLELKPKHSNQKVDILIRVSGPAGSAGRFVQVGGYGTDATLPMHHEVAHVVWPNNLHPAWFTEPIANYLAYHGRFDLNFRDEATKKKKAIYTAVAAVEKNGPIDVSRMTSRQDRRQLSPEVDKQCRQKGQWILYELDRMYGKDYMKRYVVALRKFLKRHPGRTEPMTMSEFVALSSQAAGRDLTDWFREIGTSGI